MIDITIYHNPGCGTSRNVLALIRNAVVEPRVIEYLKDPPDRATLESLLKQMNMRPRALLREKGTPFAELDLGSDHWSDRELIDQMVAHPLLINRPIVVTLWGVKLCRPSEVVLDILPLPQRGPFNKKDGEQLIDGQGLRTKKSACGRKWGCASGAKYLFGEAKSIRSKISHVTVRHQRCDRGKSADC